MFVTAEPSTPIVIDAPGQAAIGPVLATRSSAAERTILVVDDDRAIRRVVQLVLERHQYRVLAVGSGAEALTICESYRDPIDLLLTDVNMPGVGGPETAKRIGELRPDTKVLLMSGDAEDRVQQHGASGLRAQVLAKPFSVDDLAEKVREVLDK
jgi:CheY-like chemotaxis protein